MDSVISFAEISKYHNSDFSPAHCFDDVIPNVNPQTRHAYWEQVLGLDEVPVSHIFSTRWVR